MIFGPSKLPWLTLHVYPLGSSPDDFRSTLAPFRSPEQCKVHCEQQHSRDWRPCIQRVQDIPSKVSDYMCETWGVLHTMQDPQGVQIVHSSCYVNQTPANRVLQIQ
jgi:hypothetical protein